MNEQHKRLAEKIFATFNRESFWQWADADLGDHIAGEKDAHTKEEILADIVKLFNL